MIDIFDYNESLDSFLAGSQHKIHSPLSDIHSESIVPQFIDSINPHFRNQLMTLPING